MSSGHLSFADHQNRGDFEEVFMLALRDVAKAKGFSLVAKDANLNRESLYRMLSEKGNPNLSSLNRLLDSLGLTLNISMKEKIA